MKNLADMTDREFGRHMLEVLGGKAAIRSLDFGADSALKGVLRELDRRFNDGFLAHEAQKAMNKLVYKPTKLGGRNANRNRV
jgi:hypothetical protein